MKFKKLSEQKPKQTYRSLELNCCFKKIFFLLLVKSLYELQLISLFFFLFLNYSVSLQISRDCQELEPSIGEQLAALLYLEPDSELMVCFI